MLKLNKTNESGRSMVEMLGVLAIIGVLSVMGIAGYTVAMSTHHANEVLNQVNRMAILISAQRQLNGGVGSPTSEDTPYSVELDQSNTSKIVLTASNVPAGAAKRLEGMTLSVPEISVSGTTVTFTFENDLGEDPGVIVTASQTGLEEENCSDVGKWVCLSDSDYVASCVEYGQSGHWLGIPSRCADGCVDHKLHDNAVDACKNKNLIEE